MMKEDGQISMQVFDDVMKESRRIFEQAYADVCGRMLTYADVC